MKNGRERMKPSFATVGHCCCLGMGLLTGSDNNFADAGSTFGQTPSSVTPASSPTEASRARLYPDVYCS
jgi:hypothetical protein